MTGFRVGVADGIVVARATRLMVAIRFARLRRARDRR
jgi:hypothetical protein